MINHKKLFDKVKQKLSKQTGSNSKAGTILILIFIGWILFNLFPLNKNNNSVLKKEEEIEITEQKEENKEELVKLAITDIRTAENIENAKWFAEEYNSITSTQQLRLIENNEYKEVTKEEFKEITGEEYTESSIYAYRDKPIQENPYTRQEVIRKPLVSSTATVFNIGNDAKLTISLSTISIEGKTEVVAQAFIDTIKVFCPYIDSEYLLELRDKLINNDNTELENLLNEDIIREVTFINNGENSKCNITINKASNDIWSISNG